MMPKAAAPLLAAALAASACGPSVDCEKLCARTLACEVTFEAPDDPGGDKLASGERTDVAACALGCEESPHVTIESAQCIDAVDTSDARACQPEVLTCLNYTPPSAE